jgi:hypothetical protein
LTKASFDVELVAGIVNLLADDYLLDTHPPGYTALSTFATQGELDSQLGMGIVLDTEQLSRSGAAPEDGEGVTDSYYVTSVLSENQALSFDFFTVWQPRHQTVNSRDAFAALIKQHVNKKALPLAFALK